jgi:uncharacterized protein YjbI with pentapeptide repeats
MTARRGREPIMSKTWNEQNDLVFLSQIAGILQNGGVLDPSILGLRVPLDLQGLTFPTVEQVRMAGLPGLVRVGGLLEFDDATLRQVDFSKARLDFSVWNNCSFEDVCFDRAKLQQVRFFGCRFQNCTFKSTSLADAAFSIGRGGAETEIMSTVFERSDFRGASCSNPVLRSTAFLNCKLGGFVFEGALCDNVVFAGKYKELTFRGLPGDSARNRLKLDLSKASLMWLNADDGIDLSDVVLPGDGSYLIIKNRLQAVTRICDRLALDPTPGGQAVAKMLQGLFSDRGMSPLARAQDSLLISKAMIADFADTEDTILVSRIFKLIREVCQTEGFLVA